MSHQEKRINPVDTEPDISIGVDLPFENKSGGLFQRIYTTEEQGIANLKNLLLTRKGERIMQPNFGSSIYSLIFEQNTPELAIKLERSIFNDVNYWCPYIKISLVDIDQKLPGEESKYGHGIIIAISFTVDPEETNRTITLVADGTGAVTVVGE